MNANYFVEANSMRMITYQEFRARYRFDWNDKPLGAGGQSTVYVATDMVIPGKVAVKVAKIGEGAYRLAREVEIARRIAPHPNVAQYGACFTFQIESGLHDFAIMKFYELGDLDAYPVKAENRASLIAGILTGLAHIHRAGVIWRDGKGANVLLYLDEKGQLTPAITDFGIAKEFEPANKADISNSIAQPGTFEYNSPEKLNSPESLSTSSDLWSVACLAFKLFVGHTPFISTDFPPGTEAGRQALFTNIQKGELPPAISTIPEPVQCLIRACLVVKPRYRLKSAEDAQEILAGAPMPEYVRQGLELQAQNSIQKQDEPAPTAFRILYYLVIRAAAVAILLGLLAAAQALYGFLSH